MKFRIERKQVVESAKLVVGIAAVVGVGILVGSALKAIPLSEKQTIINKVCVGVGVIVIESMASDMAMSYVGEKIDEIDEAFQQLNASIEEMNKVYDDIHGKSPNENLN